MTLDTLPHKMKYKEIRKVDGDDCFIAECENDGCELEMYRLPFGEIDDPEEIKQFVEESENIANNPMGDYACPHNKAICYVKGFLYTEPESNGMRAKYLLEGIRVLDKTNMFYGTFRCVRWLNK